MNESAAANRRLVVVSNRLPFKIRTASDTLEVEPASGGLVTAFTPILEESGGKWIGWPGIVAEKADPQDIDDLVHAHGRQQGVDYETVVYSRDDRRDFYHGFSNEVIWPLFHDLQSQCVFRHRYWDAYCKVNVAFGTAIAEHCADDDFVWVQDYHLMGVASHVRDRASPACLAFFLHIPFPAVDIFAKLPWRRQVLESLLDYDLIGFQTLRDRRNFIQSLEVLLGNVSQVGDGQTVSLEVSLEDGPRRVRAGVFPISIDYREFADIATSPEVQARVERLRQLKGDVELILGIDRLDYTKGIPQKLQAVADFWERYPDMQGRTSLFQLVVPSRTDIPKYAALKTEIERLVGEINGRFSRIDWNPINYLFGSVDRPELVALYRTAEVALLTPLKDGMNLVSKEYCASSIDGSGALVLSEFAGSAAELESGALLVNSYDREEVSKCLHEAVEMDLSERLRRLEPMRESIRHNDIHRWARSFLRAAERDDVREEPELQQMANKLY